MKLNSIKFYKIILSAFLVMVITTGCESGKDDKDSEDSSNNNDSGNDNSDDRNGPGGAGNINVCEEGDTDGCGSAFASNLSEADKNIVTVKENIAPSSVGAINIGGPQLYLQDYEPEDDIKLYLTSAMEGSARALDWISGFLHSVEPQLFDIKDKEGSQEWGQKILYYKFESDTKFSIRTEGAGHDNYSIEVDGKKYILKRTDYGDEHPGDNKIVLDFTDDNNWNMVDDNTSNKCENRAKVISTYIERKGDVWSGKTMNYKPNNEDDDCTVEAADGDYFNYTQFIGDETSTTASGYKGFPFSYTDFSTIEDYDIGGLNPVNPVCIEEGKEIVINSACTSDNADISTPNYLDVSFWFTPSELSKIWVVFP